MQMLIAILLLIVLYEGARRAQFEMVEWLLDTLLPYVAIALIVLFQPEIRRALDRFGRNLSLARFSSSSPSSSFDDVVLAAGYFAQNRIGALIAFERDVGLRTYIESGIPLDANLSYDLVLAIFRPGSPMHDGAVIVQGPRIAAAACFLPLTLNPLTSQPARHTPSCGYRRHRRERFGRCRRLRADRRHFPCRWGHDRAWPDRGTTDRPAYQSLPALPDDPGPAGLCSRRARDGKAD